MEVPKAKTKKMADSMCNQRVVLDMSYDSMMSDKVNISFIICLFVSHAKQLFFIHFIV